MTEAEQRPGTPRMRWGLPTREELAKPGARPRWRRNAVILGGQALATMAVCLLLLGVTDNAGYRILAWVVLASAVLELVYGVVLGTWSRSARG